MEDASDPKQVRKAAKAAKIKERLRQDVIRNLMSSISGRCWLYDLLSACHVFSTSFALNALQMGFNEGERNVGLKVLGDIMQVSPEQYPLMMREANDRSTASDDRAYPDGPTGSEYAGGSDSAGRIEDEPRQDPDAPDPFGYYKRD